MSFLDPNAKVSSVSKKEQKRLNNEADKKVLYFLIERIRQEWRLLVLSLLGGLGGAAISITMAQLIRKFMDDGLKKQDWPLIQSLCLGIVGIFLVDGFCEYVHRFSLRLAVERSIRKIRNEVFERLLIFSHAQVSRFTSGKAVSRILNDTQVLSLSTHLMADLIKEPLMILGILGYLLYLHWKLTLVCLLAVPVISLLGKAFGKSARRNQTRIQNSLEEVSNHIIETMGGLRTAHSLGQTGMLKAEFFEKNQLTFRFLIRLARVEEMVSPITKWVSSGIAAILVLYGGYLVVHNEMTIGGLTAFLAAAGSLQQPLKQFNQISVRIQQLIAAATRIYEITTHPLDRLAESQEQWLHVPFKSSLHRQGLSAKDLEWRQLSFAYPKRDESDLAPPLALENIHLKLETGTRLALVGRSGSGKSTLSLLAMRFLDPQRGGVFLGGRNATEWDLPDYRQHFSYVSQDLFLFNRSVKDNLLMAAPESTESQIWEALEKAQIRNFFEHLPQKLNTLLGEHASTLSGGEKQRLAIARAFLRNSPILVLDEATSQLDAHSEAAVQKALGELMKDRSVLIIAHRLSTVREADQVAVMDHGHVLELGAPKELLKIEQGAFAQLWQQQFSSTSLD